MKTNRDAKAAELIAQIGRNATAARDLLALAAECLEAGEPLPGKLAGFLAASFREAVSEPCAERGKALAFALGLSAPGKEGRPRAAIPTGDVALTVAAFGETVSETKLKNELAAAYDVSTGTALARVKETKAALVEARDNTREIIERNELTGIVRPR
ncbi:hypothetical protein GCM10022279_29970 [Comamonas faecalis]|uniref:Uncharacterized protein n=1 Tax=Comamonas faecalis TaxID=1387849 RepID=A0ABP7RYW6_9BURK